jgi:hypothetical protein
MTLKVYVSFAISFMTWPWWRPWRFLSVLGYALWPDLHDDLGSFCQFWDMLYDLTFMTTLEVFVSFGICFMTWPWWRPWRLMTVLWCALWPDLGDDLGCFCQFWDMLYDLTLVTTLEVYISFGICFVIWPWWGPWKWSARSGGPEKTLHLLPPSLYTLLCTYLYTEKKDSIICL